LPSCVTYLHIRSLPESNSYIVSCPLDISELVWVEGYNYLIKIHYLNTL